MANLNDELRVIPNIPLEYLKTRFRTHPTRDIECLQCQHIFKAGKYKVNNTKLRQHILSKHKEDLNSWLTSNGNLFLPQIRLELYERPWRCTQCTKCYKLKHHLKQHMETAHGESPTVANRVTIKQEVFKHSDLSEGMDSMNASMNISMDAAKQFLKLKESNNAPNGLGTLEALVQSAFGNANGSMDPQNAHSGPPSPRSDNGNAPPSKLARFDNELMNIFTSSGVVPSQLASQISQSLGLNVKIEEDGTLGIDDSIEPEKQMMEEHLQQNGDMMAEEIAQHPIPASPEEGEVLTNIVQTSAQPTTTVTRIVHAPTNGPVIMTSTHNPVPYKLASTSPNSLKRVYPSSSKRESISTKEHRFKSNSAGVRGQFTCKYCLITFPDNILFGLHMGQHCVSEPFKCNICSYTCSDRYDFMFHFAMGRHEK